MTDARETRTKNSHEKLARNRTRSIWCEKLAREISCCKSVWHTYKFLARVSRTCVMGFRIFVDHRRSSTHCMEPDESAYVTTTDLWLPLIPPEAGSKTRFCHFANKAGRQSKAKSATKFFFIFLVKHESRGFSAVVCNEHTEWHVAIIVELV